MKYLGFIFNILNGSFSLMGFFKQVMLERNMISHANKVTAINIAAMKVLLGWSIGNIIVGGILLFFSSGLLLSFSQMTVGWNIVNLIISLVGLNMTKSMSTTLMSSLNPISLIRYIHSVEKILVFNSGLDIAYAIFGIYLIEKGTMLESSMWSGFGAAVMVQGLFLLTFDSVLYFLNRRVAREVFEEIAQVQEG